MGETVRVRLTVLAFVLAVPLVGLGVSQGVKAHLNSKLHSMLAKDYPSANPTAISAVNLDRLCGEQQAQDQALCGTDSNLNLTTQGAIGSGAGGLLLLAVILVAGIASRRRRRLLLYLFKPGLYITVVALIALTVVNAAVLISSLYYGVSALASVIPIGLLVGISLAAAYGVLVLARGTFAILKKAQTQIIGVSVSREDAPDLWTKVDQLADKLGTLNPQRIVVGLEPNFFVTEANVTCLTGAQRGRTLYCSLPLCRILTPDEFSAIVGHELGHFRGLDTKFSQKFFPIYEGTVESINALSRRNSGASSVVLLPAIAILSYFLQCFSVAEREISRDRELKADDAGASITSPKVMASALVKVHAFSGVWTVIQQASANALREGKAFVNASIAFAEATGNAAQPSALQGLSDMHLAHPTDSHPALRVRLENLGISIESVQAEALNVHPHPMALDSISDPGKRERELSNAFQAILARQLGIRIPEENKESETVSDTVGEQAEPES